MVNQRQLQQLIRKRREQNIRKAPKSRRKPKFPQKVWREYDRALRKRVRVLEDTYDEIIRPRLERWQREAEANRPDSMNLDEDWPEQVSSSIDKLDKQTEEELEDPEKLARRTAEEIDEFNKNDFEEMYKEALGVTPAIKEPWKPDELSAFVRENVRWIKDLKEESLNNMERIIQSGFREGLTASEVSGQIRNQFRMDRNRSQRIARDQVGKLNGQLSKLRQKEAGIERFRWITAGDERVRDSHRDRNNEIYEFDNPPQNELPGEPINCRCVAEPVFEDLEEELES